MSDSVKDKWEGLLTRLDSALTWSVGRFWLVNDVCFYGYSTQGLISYPDGRGREAFLEAVPTNEQGSGYPVPAPPRPLVRAPLGCVCVTLTARDFYLSAISTEDAVF